MTEIMQMVIDKLGVNVGERFKIKDEDGELLYGSYYVNEKGIMISANQESRIGVLWQPLLIGEYQIVKLPFKPERLQTYWCVDFNNNSLKTISNHWYDFPTDYINYSFGNCFRTEEEITEEDKKRILTEMKREYENG